MKKFFPKISLRQRLLLGIIGVIMVIGILSTLIVADTARDVLVEAEKNKLIRLVEDKGDFLDYVINNSIDLVETIASQENIQDYFKNNRGEQDLEMLEGLKNYNIGGQYLSIYLMDESGNTLVSTDASFVGNNYSFREYFNNAIEGETTATLALGVTSGQIGYYFSTPVMNEGIIIGVVVLKIKTEAIHETIEIDRGNIMLSDKYGVVVYSNEKDKTLKSLADLSEESLDEINKKRIYEGLNIEPMAYGDVMEAFKEIEDEAIWMELYDEFDQEEESISIARVGETDFYIILEESFDDYTDEANNVARIVGISVLFMLIIITVVVFFLIIRFIQPLKILTKTSSEIAKKLDLNRRIKVSTKDEIGELGNAFNKMIRAIKKSREQVENKVHSQTKDIKKQKSKLENQKKAILNVLEDVNAEKANSEALAQDLKKFKLALDNTSDMVFITNAERECLYINKASIKITGYNPEEVIGKKLYPGRLWLEEEDKKNTKKLNDRLFKNKKPLGLNLKNKRKGGDIYDAILSLSPILDDSGDIKFILGIERDITKEKQIDKMKTEFISLASHQLRTPLSAMKWLIEMLVNGDAGDLTKEQKEFVTQLRDSNERMIKLVNSLLNVSRIESGRLIVEPKPTNIVNLLKDVINELKPEAAEKKIKIRTKIGKGVNKKINLDPKLTVEMISNLITNAIKYSPVNTEVKVTIKTKKDQIQIIVEDEGYGIPKDEQENVFKKFFRASNAVQLEPDGSGLGLYMVKSIIENCNGSIEFKRRKQKGSKFTLIIPQKGMSTNKGDVKINS